MQIATALRRIFLLLALLPAMASAQAPDRVLYNGRILTVDQKFSTAQALAIRGERIVAVGDNATVRKLADSRTVQTDLGGRTVIPGLIDNHLHYLRGSNFMPYELRLEGVLSRKEALEKIAARAKNLARAANRANGFLCWAAGTNSNSPTSPAVSRRKNWTLPPRTIRSTFKKPIPTFT